MKIVSGRIVVTTIARSVIAPRLVSARVTDREYDIEERDGVFYILTNADGAEDFKIMTAPVATPDAEHWTELVPHTPGVLILDIILLRHHLIRLELKPRRKSPFLFDGAVYLNPDTGDVVRVEGSLSKRPSFWTRRMHVTREYARIDGVRVPVSMHSTADVLITGASEFSMSYEYLEINGRAITSQ